METNEFRFGIKPAIPTHWQTTVHHDGFEIEIAASWIEARIEDDGRQELQRERIEPIIHGIARRISLSEKKRFIVTLSSIASFNAKSNHRHTTAFMSATASGKATVHADMVLKSSDGTVVADSRQERILGMLSFAHSCAGDQTLIRMSDYLLEYYSDPEKKLAPLFDIIELAEEAFRGKSGVAQTLGISVKKMKSATGIMNNREIHSSRHRGQALGNQREPLPEEARSCEAVAEKIVAAYTKIAEQIKSKEKGEA